MHLKWKVWIFSATCCIIFTPLLVSSTNICRTCEADSHDCPSTSWLPDCYCIRHNFHHTQQRWDGWQGRYVIVKQEFLYANAKCFDLKDLDENSILNPSTCPEDPCRYITFYRSNISTVAINFFKGAPHLEAIYLNSSGVQNLQVGAFAGLPKLQTLQMEDNKLTKITAGSLNSLIALKTLDVHSNQISAIEDMAFLGLDSLESLDLSRNQLSAISRFSLKPLVNLRVLILSYNFLSLVDFNTGKLNKLQSLYLNHNNIERIEECFEGTAVNELFLQDNRISYLNGTCFPNDLSILNLANNNISILDPYILENLNNLTTLNVSKNAIKTIPIDMFKSSKSLLSLDVSQNEISQLKTGIFSGANNIEYLNLSSINVETIDSHVLIPLASLKILDVSNNNLDFWDSESFVHFDNLKKMFVAGNNFSCKIVSSIFRNTKEKNFSLVYDINYTVENINGLPCGYITTDQQNSTKETHTSINTLMENWKDLKNSLNNITKTVAKDIGEFFSMEKSLMKSLDAQIPKTIENSLKSGVKIQTELVKSEVRGTLQDTVNMAKLDLVDLLKNITKNIETKPSNISQTEDLLYFEKNITSLVQNLEFSVNDLQDTIGSIGQNQFTSINSTMHNMKKNLRSLFQLEILIVICFCICAFMFLVCKTVSCCSGKNKRRFELGQELPILSQ